MRQEHLGTQEFLVRRSDRGTAKESFEDRRKTSAKSSNRSRTHSRNWCDHSLIALVISLSETHTETKWLQIIENKLEDLVGEEAALDYCSL